MTDPFTQGLLLAFMACLGFLVSIKVLSHKIDTAPWPGMVFAVVVFFSVFFLVQTVGLASRLSDPLLSLNGKAVIILGLSLVSGYCGILYFVWSALLRYWRNGRKKGRLEFWLLVAIGGLVFALVSFLSLEAGVGMLIRYRPALNLL